MFARVCFRKVHVEQPTTTYSTSFLQTGVWLRALQLSVALVCGGHTQLQRDASLAAARVAAHYLQSDRSHGLLPQQQLQEGAGACCLAADVLAACW